MDSSDEVNCYSMVSAGKNKHNESIRKRIRAKSLGKMNKIEFPLATAETAIRIKMVIVKINKSLAHTHPT